MLSVTIIGCLISLQKYVGYVPVRKNHNGSIDRYKQTSLTVPITIIDCV